MKKYYDYDFQLFFVCLCSPATALLHSFKLGVRARTRDTGVLSLIEGEKLSHPSSENDNPPILAV